MPLQQTGLPYISGVIKKEDASRFGRIIFRATRGNSWSIFNDIDMPKIEKKPTNLDEDEDPKADLKAHQAKTVFFVVYPTTGATIKTKLLKICESFSANVVALPETTELREKKEDELLKQILATNKVHQYCSTILTKLAHLSHKVAD